MLVLLRDELLDLGHAEAHVPVLSEANRVECAPFGEALHRLHRAAEQAPRLRGRDEEPWFGLRRHGGGIAHIARYRHGVAKKSEKTTPSFEERMKAAAEKAGTTVKIVERTPGTGTVTFLAKRPPENPLEDDDGSGAVE